MAQKYEDSRQDRANDRRIAKMLGQTPEQFEGSQQDQVLDARGQAAMNRAAAKQAGPDVPTKEQGVQPHHFGHHPPPRPTAHKRPMS